MASYPDPSNTTISWSGEGTYTPPAGNAVAVTFSSRFEPKDVSVWPSGNVSWEATYTPPAGNAIVVEWQRANAIVLETSLALTLTFRVPSTSLDDAIELLVPESISFDLAFLPPSLHVQLVVPALSFTLALPVPTAVPHVRLFVVDMLEFRLYVIANAIGSRPGYNFAPPSLWPGYTSDGSSITIPLAALPTLLAADAHTTTGDWQEIVRSILETERAYLARYDVFAEPLTVAAKQVMLAAASNETGSWIKYRNTHTFIADSLCFNVNEES